MLSQRLVENAYLLKKRRIYSLSLLQALPYKMVVQEKEEVMNIPSVMGYSGHEQFLFYFILFSNFIGILFCFVFLLDNKEAHDTAVI